MLWIKAALMMLSFAGLCAGLRVLCHADGWVTPALAAGGAIALLCAGGMAGLLLPAWILLYAAGFAGAVYAYAVKRAAPDPLEVALALFYVAFLVLRFGRSHLYASDDLSHWGLVARYLVRYDRFPDATADFVRFQSYPLGGACFVYYISRGTANLEGAYLIAQNLLKGALYAPVFAVAKRKDAKTLIPFSAAVFFLFFHFNEKTVTLKVDHLLGFYGLAICALFCLESRDLRRLAALLLPVTLSVVMIKSSGLVFAVAAAAAALIAARRAGSAGDADGAKRASMRLAALAALPILFYLLWMLRVRLVYVEGLETKHAVSLAAYRAMLQQKGLPVLLRIAGAFLRALITPTTLSLLALAFAGGCGALTLWLARRRGAADACLRRMALHAGLYAGWLVLLLAMYFVSMPTEEALAVADFDRYNSTGLLVLMGLFLLHLLAEWQRAEPAPRALGHAVRAASAVAVLGVLALYFIPGVEPHNTRFDLRHDYLPFRGALVGLKQAHDLPDGAQYLVFYAVEPDESLPIQKYYTVKYEFETLDVYAVADYRETDYFVVGTLGNTEAVASPVDFIAANIDDCAACLILAETGKCAAEIDGFFESYTGDTPVYTMIVGA